MQEVDRLAGQLITRDSASNDVRSLLMVARVIAAELNEKAEAPNDRKCRGMWRGWA
jgi:hypothetical protein